MLADVAYVVSPDPVANIHSFLKTFTFRSLRIFAVLAGCAQILVLIRLFQSLRLRPSVVIIALTAIAVCCALVGLHHFCIFGLLWELLLTIGLGRVIRIAIIVVFRVFVASLWETALSLAMSWSILLFIVIAVVLLTLLIQEVTIFIILIVKWLLRCFGLSPVDLVILISITFEVSILVGGILQHSWVWLLFKRLIVVCLCPSVYFWLVVCLVIVIVRIVCIVILPIILLALLRRACLTAVAVLSMLWILAACFVVIWDCSIILVVLAVITLVLIIGIMKAILWWILCSWYVAICTLLALLAGLAGSRAHTTCFTIIIMVILVFPWLLFHSGPLCDNVS